VTIKSKLREISYPNMTSICPPLDKVKAKKFKKSQQNWFERSTKCNP